MLWADVRRELLLAVKPDPNSVAFSLATLIGPRTTESKLAMDCSICTSKINGDFRLKGANLLGKNFSSLRQHRTGLVIC